MNRRMQNQTTAGAPIASRQPNPEPHLIYLLAPLLLGSFPALLYYANNAAIVRLSSLVKMLGLYFMLIAAIYFAALIVLRLVSSKAAIITCIVMLFFNIYGSAYAFLIQKDWVRVEHYTLLPLALFLVMYLSWWAVRLNPMITGALLQYLALVFGLLFIFNLVKIVPTEITKIKDLPAQGASVSAASATPDTSLPDIYYIVFDEFSGFKPMREYWKYHEIDQFEQYLRDKGFFLINNSYSESETTLYELASRLNFEKLPCCDHYETYFEGIADSEVARYLKSKGYTTVAFEELRSSFPTDHPFQADYLYENDPNDPAVSDTFLDEYGILVVDKTMLSAFPDLYKTIITNQWLKNHRNMIYFTIGKMGNLEDVPAPRFVYVHLLLPHVPFMFDKDGNVIEQQYRNNWNYYLGNYIFTLDVAKQIVSNIQSTADPHRPPVIILQSDHGARNQVIVDNQDTLLQNFPDEFKRSILFAIYMPNHSLDEIPQDFKPINTFPLILNKVFEENLPYH